MLRVWFAAALASAAAFVCACGGSTVGGETDDGGSSGGPSKGGAPSKPGVTAPQQCKAYVSTRCKKSFGCYVKVGRLAEKDLQYNVDQCTKLLDTKLPCSAVQSTGAGYDQCLKELNTMSCSSWDVEPAQFPNVRLPSSCDDAIYL
jgi:hypothetical protein